MLRPTRTEGFTLMGKDDNTNPFTFNSRSSNGGNYFDDSAYRIHGNPEQTTPEPQPQHQPEMEKPEFEQPEIKQHEYDEDNTEYQPETQFQEQPAEQSQEQPYDTQDNTRVYPSNGQSQDEQLQQDIDSVISDTDGWKIADETTVGNGAYQNANRNTSQSNNNTNMNYNNQPNVPYQQFDNPNMNYPDNQKPDNLLVWAILSTILCCLPTGIVAIIKSTQVDKYWAMGNYDAAYKAAKDTKTWCWVGFGLGLAVYIFYIVYLVVVGAAVLASQNYSDLF